MVRQSWDEYFMEMARHVGSRSKDRSTKVGAVIVGPDREIRSTGYNDFPRGVNDNVDARRERPTKYPYTEHAERNAIYNAARVGIPLAGCTLYVDAGFPCSECARAIIQSGIREVVVGKMEHIPGWEDNSRIALEMLAEVGIFVRLPETN